MCNDRKNQVARSASLRLSSDSLSGVSNDIRLKSHQVFFSHLSQLNGPILARLDFVMIPNFREKILAWKSSPPRTPKKVIIEERVNLFSQHNIFFCFCCSKTMSTRAGPPSQKWSDQQITVNPTGSIHKKARGKKFDPKKLILIWGFWGGIRSIKVVSEF